MGYDGSLKFDTRIDESGFNSGINRLGSIAKKGIAVLSAAVGAGSAAVVKIGMDFESQMSKVQAISGATGDELAALTEKAKEMGAKTKFSATESAQALEYMAMAGWKTNDMLGGLEGIMNLAAASGEDLATTSDIVTDALTAFGMSESESGHFADVLAAASSNANTNVSMMGETFKYVAPVAGALGYSAEDCAVAIGLMANSGIKAGQAGTSLRAIMSRMAKPTDEVETAMKKLGISLTNSQGNMKSLNEVMTDLRNGFSGLSEAEAAQMAAAIGGQEAMSGLLAIVNASDADFAKLESSIYSCDGAAAQMAETMNTNLKGQFTILKSSAEALGLELYESIQEPLTGIAKTGIAEINKLTEAFKQDGASGLIKAGSEIIADLVTGMIEQTPMAIDTAITICDSMLGAFEESSPMLLSAGKQLFQYFLDGMNQMTQEAPAITARATEIISSLISGIQEAAPQLLTVGADMLVSFAMGISQQLPQLVPQALQLVVTLADAIISNIPTIINAGISLLKGLAQGIINSLPLLITEGPLIINDFADEIYSGLGQIILAGAQMLLSLLQGIWDNRGLLLENASEIFMAFLNIFSLSKMLSLGNSLIKNLESGIKSLGPNIASAGKNILTNLVNGIKSLATHPVTTIKGIITNISNAFTNFSWSTIGKNIISGIASGLKKYAGTIVDAAKAAAGSALSAAKKALGIHSPSTVFRDQVGKNMALGMGEGFEKNVPVESMEDTISGSVNKLKRASYSVTAKAPVSVASQSVIKHYSEKEYVRNPDDTVLQITNVFEIDGTPLVKKTTKATIKELSGNQKDRDKTRGK